MEWHTRVAQGSAYRQTNMRGNQYRLQTRGTAPRNRVRVSEKQAGGGGVSCLLNTPTTTSRRGGYRTNNNNTERRKRLVPYCICIILIALIGYLQFDLTGRSAVRRTTK
jgi:hypothetical protein